MIPGVNIFTRIVDSHIDLNKTSHRSEYLPYLLLVASSGCDVRKLAQLFQRLTDEPVRRLWNIKHRVMCEERPSLRVDIARVDGQHCGERAARNLIVALLGIPPCKGDGARDGLT